MIKVLTVMTPCYNEEGNVEPVHRAVREIFSRLPRYRYHHLFIDNASTDRTLSVLREIAANDPNVQVIVNTRNFGHVRSPYYGLLQGTGDAVITLAADLQDPPEMIPEFLQKWEEGYKVVVGVRTESEGALPFSAARRLYYWLVNRLSDAPLISGFAGFGLYDQDVVKALRSIREPYPYFRGLLAYLGYDLAAIPYRQRRRTRGLTKNNFYTLYDLAMLGITNHSKVPLRIATMVGFALSGLSLLVALVYLGLKLLWWDQFSLGLAPIVIGLFFFASVQLFFIGIIGEYVGAIHTQVHDRPLVVEKERINFPVGVEAAEASGSGSGDRARDGSRV